MKNNLTKFKSLLVLMIALITCSPQMWSADQVLKTVDFSTSAWSSATFTANATTVVDDVTASSSSSSSKPTISISSGKFTMSGNMSSGKNCVGFQVSGIQYGTLIIEVYSDASTITRCNYTVKDGGSSFSTSDAGNGTSSTAGEPIIVTGLTKTSAYVYVGRQGSSYTQFSKIIVKTPNPTGKTYAESTFYTTYASSSKTNAQLISSASFPENFLPIFAGASALNDKPASTPTVTTPYDFSGVSTSSKSYILQTAENNVLLLNNVANVKSVRFYGDGNGSSGNISVNVTKQSGSGSTFSVSNISFTSTKTILEHSTGDLTGKSGYDANTFYNYKFTFSKKFHIWGVYVEAIEAEKDYTVTAATSTGTNTYGTVSASASSLDQGETTTITATPATGYQVTNWAVSGTGATISPNGASNSNTTTLTMGTQDATVTATFGPKSYTVTLNNQSATSAGTENVTTTYNSNTNLTSAITCPTKTSKVFAGYFTATNGGGVQLIDPAGNWIASAGGGSTYLDASKNWKYDNSLDLYACWMEYAKSLDLQNYVETEVGSSAGDKKTSKDFTHLTSNNYICSLSGNTELDNSSDAAYRGLKFKNSGDYILFLVPANYSLSVKWGYVKSSKPKYSINGGSAQTFTTLSTSADNTSSPGDIEISSQSYIQLVKLMTSDGNATVLKKVTITSGGCSATANAGEDKATTYNTGVAMAATAATSGYTGAWSIKASSPSTSTSQLSSTSAYNATFTPNAVGTYTLIWTVTDNSDGSCSASDEATVTVSKANISPSLSYSSTTLTVGDNSSSPTVSGNPGSGSVSYAVTSASPEGCITVNGSTGVVTAVEAGSGTVTATVAATTNYNGNTCTANFTVNAAAVTYTVTYDGSDAASGDVPTDSNSPYTSGSTVTVLGNTGSMTRTISSKEATFYGWNTNSDMNSGTNYAAAATFNISSNVTLYARWGYGVSYELGSGSWAGDAPQAYYIYNIAYALPASSAVTAPAGKEFDHWEISDATATSIAAGTVGAQTVTAVYSDITYAITYAAGTYGSGSLAGGSKTYGIAYTLSSSDDAFTRAGFIYDGWSVNADGSTKDYELGGSYTTNAAQCFYPHWVADCPASGSGRTVYKFEVKSDVSSGNICTTQNVPVSLSSPTQLTTLTGGTLQGLVTSSSMNNLAFNSGRIQYANGSAGVLILTLDCAVKTGDIIRFVNYSSSNSKYNYLRHTSNSTTTNQITLNASTTAGTVQEIVVPSAFNNKEELYIVAGSNTTGISYFEIIRPYVVTLNANTNGGKVDGEDTKTMYFVADEAQLLPRATKSDYLFKGWFNASSGGDAVANPYTATTSPKTLYAQFDDCSSKIGTVYKLQVKTELTNGSIAAGDLNEGNYLSAMDGGTAVITGSHAQIVNNNAIDFKDNGDYITVNLDCELKAGDYFKTTISGSKSGIKVTTTGSTTSLQNISYGTNVETEVPASLVGSKTFRIYRQDSNCGGLSYFEIVRPAGSEVTYNNGGHGEAPSSTTAAAVTLADISVTGWKNTGWKADVDVKVSGSTVSAETEIAVGTVVTILEATTFTAQWVDCCFEFTSSSQSSSISAITTNANIPASTWETATLTGGTMKNTSSGSLSVNKTYGMVMESGKEVTVTLADDHALGVGSVITLSAGVSDASGSQTSGLVVSGNTCSPASYTSSTAGAPFTQTYTVTALDGLAGTKSFTLAMKSDLTKTYLNGITVTGCVECTPITPSLNYDKTTLWVNDGDIATPTLDKDESTGSVTYSSSNTDIATVNESTGVVTAVAGGNVTITASIAADGTHCANTATCNLTIKNATCAEVVIAGVTLSAKNAGTPEGTLIASSSGYVVNTQKWEAPDGGCGTGGKLGAEGYYICLTLKSGESFQNGDKVIVDIATVPDIGDGKLHIYAGTSSAGTQLGENASPVCGENEIILSGISSSTPSITLYRTNGDDKQNPYVVSMKVKRFICTDCLGFFDGTDNGSWNTAGNWIGSTGVSASVPTASDRVHIYKPVTVDTKTAVAKSVVINTDEPNTGKLTIANNGVLTVDETITAIKSGVAAATAVNDVIIDCGETSQGALIFEQPASGELQTQGTVNFYTKSSRVGGKLQWQYVGYPFISGYDYDYGGYYINKYSETQGGWIVMRDQDKRSIAAWDGLAISGDGAGGAQLQGKFVPTTGDKEFTLTYTAGKGKGKNLIGNSWTAPIQILEMEEEDFGGVGGARATIYVFNTGRYGSKEVSPSGSWVTLAIDAVKDGVAAGTWTNLTVIPAFQGFQVKTADTEDKTLTLNYDKHVRPATDDTAMNVPLRAPARHANSEINHMRLTVESDVAHQDVFLFEGPEFSEDFDNGWDGDYVGVSGQHAYLYVVSPTLGKMAIDAESSLEGRIVALQSAAEKEYTFTFAGNGMGYYLNDLKTQTSTLIEAGNSYTFTYEQGDDYNRFMISATPFAKTTPTGIEDADWNGTGVQKVLYKDHMYIIRCGRVFDATGAMVK